MKLGKLITVQINSSEDLEMFMVMKVNKDRVEKPDFGKFVKEIDLVDSISTCDPQLTLYLTYRNITKRINYACYPLTQRILSCLQVTTCSTNILYKFTKESMLISRNNFYLVQDIQTEQRSHWGLDLQRRDILEKYKVEAKQIHREYIISPVYALVLPPLGYRSCNK